MLTQLTEDASARLAQAQGKWREKKQTAEWTDIHGRTWVGMTRMMNDGLKMPAWVSSLRPDGWSPPHPELVPPAQYLRPSNTKMLRVLIDYARWREDLRRAWKDAKSFKMRAASDLYGRKAGEALSVNDPDVAEEIGTLPLDPVWVDAMEAGDLWALGIPKPNGQPREVPEWAKPYQAKLASVVKAQIAAERYAEHGLRFVTSDEPMQAPRPFVPQAYDEVEDAGAAAPRRRGRPRKVAASEPIEPAVTLADDEDDDE